jgi:amidohydrolase
MYAAADTFSIAVSGRQTHGARPWQGIDPIVVSAQIVNALQAIISRQTDIAKLPAVLTIGSIHGGIRHNIIPDEVIMQGTLRTFDTGMRADLLARLQRTIESIAEASGTEAELRMETPQYPVTVNDPQLTERVLPSLQRAIGAEQVRVGPLITGAEDFAFFANEVPGFYFMVGVTPPDEDLATAPANHSPLFHVDESALAVGMKAMLYTVVDYLQEE